MYNDYLSQYFEIIEEQKKEQKRIQLKRGKKSLKDCIKAKPSKMKKIIKESEIVFDDELVPGIDAELTEVSLYPPGEGDGIRVKITGIMRTGGHSPEQLAKFKSDLVATFREIALDVDEFDDMPKE
jgi:hypothetical protein